MATVIVINAATYIKILRYIIMATRRRNPKNRTKKNKRIRKRGGAGSGGVSGVNTNKGTYGVNGHLREIEAQEKAMRNAQEAKKHQALINSGQVRLPNSRTPMTRP
jgi:hypothetical protein